MSKSSTTNSSNSQAPISRDVALRVALASRVLPDVNATQVLNILGRAIGLPPTPRKLSKLTIKALRSAAEGDFDQFEISLLEEVLAFLKGDKGVDQKADSPEVEAYNDGDIKDSIRVAFASNGGEELNGHFGSCKFFLVYQINAEEQRLISVRKTDGPEARDDKNVYRAGLIDDCQVLFVASIGGPAAAKVVKAGIFPMKYPAGGSCRERIADLQKVIVDAPPPWLAKAMGRDQESRVRFEHNVAEG